VSTFWLMNLPTTDPAFDALHRVAEFDPDGFPALRNAHQQAVMDAAWGRDLETLDERAEELREFAGHDVEPRDQYEAEVWRRDELEALGYALGVTAVRVALVEHREALVLSGAA
jgi:hypothetical protein